MGRLAVLLQVTLVPLCVSPYHQAPYLLPKHALAVWTALIVLLPLLAAQAVLNRDRRLWDGWLDRPFLVLGLWMLVSMLFSLRLEASVHLFLLYVAAWVTWKAVVVFCDTSRSRHLALGVFVAAAVVAASAVWVQVARGVRLPPGTFGNKNFVAQYLILPFSCLLPFVFQGLLRGLRARWRFVWVLAAFVLLGATLIQLRTKGAFFGVLLAAVAVAAGFHLRKRWSLSLSRMQGRLLICFFVLMAVGVGIRLFSAEGSLRDVATGVMVEDSVRIRLEIWKSSLGMLRDYWWRGVGLGNYQLMYPLYRLQSETEAIPWLTTVAHAHNCYIEWVAELGVIGLLLLFWAMNRSVSKMLEFLSAAEGRSWLFGMGLLAALVASDGHSFFSSNVYQIGPVIGLGFLFGLLESLLRDFASKATPDAADPEPAAEVIDPKSRGRIVVAGTLAAVLVLGAHLLLNGPIFRASVADIQLRRAIATKNTGDWDKAAELFEQSARVNPHSDAAPYYRALLGLEQGRPKATLHFVDLALRARPYSHDAYLLQGLALERLGRTKDAAEAYRTVLRFFPPHEVAKARLEQLSKRKSN